MNRRHFIYITSSAATGIIITGTLNSCISKYNPSKLNKIWTDKFDFQTKDTLKQYLQIIRCGILAPSSYNNQPWLFKISDNSIEIIPDMSRSLLFADPQNRELMISLGCCLENILIAAKSFGFDTSYNFIENDQKIIIYLDKNNITPSSESALFRMITQRRTTRAEYDKAIIPTSILNSLINGNTPRIRMSLLEGNDSLNKMLEYEKEANRILFENRKYTEELQNWTRFSDNEASDKLDGLYSRSMGDAATTEWLGNVYYDLWVTPETQNKYDSKMINSSSAAILLFSKDNPTEWLNSGRELQNLLLRITEAGLKYSFICKSSKIEALRIDMASEFKNKGLLPQTALRIGYSEYLPRSLRRPVKDFLLR